MVVKKAKREKEVTHRTGYDYWVNSQLSIARFYGGATIEGRKYIFDPKCEWDENGKGKPDLVTYDKVIEK